MAPLYSFQKLAGLSLKILLMKNKNKNKGKSSYSKFNEKLFVLEQKHILKNPDEETYNSTTGFHGKFYL